MPAVTREGDQCTGHGCHPPRPSTSGSPNVYINGIPAHRVGDTWAVHCCPTPSPACHDSVLASGSPTVNVNDKPLGRIGDSVACDSVVAQGSGNVFAN